MEEVKKEQQQKSQDKPAAGTEGSSTGDSQLKEGQEAEGSVSKSETKEPAKHTAEELAEMEKYLMGKVLAAAWNGSKFEIQGTVRAVCDNILEDKDVSLETRVARAKALRLIGDVFVSMTRTEAEAEEARVLKNWSQKQVKRKKRHQLKQSNNKNVLNTFLDLSRILMLLIYNWYSLICGNLTF